MGPLVAALVPALAPGFMDLFSNLLGGMFSKPEHKESKPNINMPTDNRQWNYNYNMNNVMGSYIVNYNKLLKALAWAKKIMPLSNINNGKGKFFNIVTWNKKIKPLKYKHFNNLFQRSNPIPVASSLWSRMKQASSKMERQSSLNISQQGRRLLSSELLLMALLANNGGPRMLKMLNEQVFNNFHVPEIDS